VWRALTRQGIEGDELVRLQGAPIERAIMEAERGPATIVDPMSRPSPSRLS
jgi:hypothetical protein